MNISSFKKVVDALARFADMRAPDSDPRSKIGVQVDKHGKLTLISGSSCCGLLYRIDDEISFDKPVLFAIEAKPLLQAAKVLKGKGTISIVVTSDSLSINVDGGGGTVKLIASCELKDAGFVPKIKSSDCTMRITGDTWEQLYRIIPAVSTIDIEPPTLTIGDGMAHIVAVAKGERPCYARFSAPADGPDWTSVAVNVSFWESLKAFTSDGNISWSADGAVATAGNVSVWSKAITFDPAPFEPWPILESSGEMTAYAIIDRTMLIEAIRGITPGEDLDKYGRITFEINDTSVSLSPFGDEGGISIPCKTMGKTMRTVRAEYITKMLKASVGKEVRVGVYKAPPISISSQDMSGWTILVAPVALG